MIIGYNLSGPDNDSHMYYHAAGLPVCPQCGYKMNSEYINPDLRIKRRKYDFSFTYDNCAIVSLKFKEFCIRNGYSEIEFQKLPADSAFFLLAIRNVLDFDVEKANTRFLKFCPACNRYESVVGIAPFCLKNIHMPLEDNFYRTNLEFGSGNEKNPGIIVGVDTYSKLKREQFTGLEYARIEA